MSNRDKIIDNHTINNLLIMDEGEDGAFLKEIVVLFIEQMPVLLKDIKSSISAKDSQKLIRSAHNLKGASLNLGAELLASVSKKIEEFGKEEDFVSAEKEINRLENVCDKTKTELKNITNFKIQ